MKVLKQTEIEICYKQGSWDSRAKKDELEKLRARRKFICELRHVRRKRKGE